ncbi:MAG: MarC family protein [Sulfurospirillum sp.]|nr:MarC family protein [Sulfurospirillum sp.]
MSFFISIYIKFFFIMTPFFVVSMFLSMTSGLQDLHRKKIALKVTLAIIITSLILLFFGQYIFDLFGITLDAFKIGAGSILFLTAVDLMQKDVNEKVDCETDISKHAIVPLAIPITVGPGTIGALLVMGGEMNTFKLISIGSLALLCAILSVGVMLYLSSSIKKIVGSTGLLVMSKITALILSALSAQLIFSGIKSFLGL